MSNETRPFQLGLLLVHGIGRQPSGDTLVRWGDVLLKTIRGATQNQVMPTVEWGTLGKNGAGRAEAVIRLHAGRHAEDWLLVEGWWADSFPAPTYGELVSWSARALPWSLAINTAQTYWRSPANSNAWQRVSAAVLAVAQFVVALLLAPLFILLLFVALFVGLLPIPQVRTIILSAQSILTATVGDTLAFVESPVRAALVRSRILEGLDRLVRDCERTIIIAHSQGAAAVLDALGGILDPDLKDRRPDLGAVPNTLLTFGAGTNQLVSLKVLSGGTPKSIGGNPAYAALAALLTATALLGWFYSQFQAHQIRWSDVWWAALLWFFYITVFVLLLVGSAKFLKWLAARMRWQNEDKVARWTIVPLMLAGIFGLIRYADVNHPPFGWLNVLLFMLMIVAASARTILSKEMRGSVTEPVRTPTHLGRWVDLYGSADPVPNGPTRTNEGVLESLSIWNEGSVFRDHTRYWQNLDGFVLRVVRTCAQTARSVWQDKLPLETESIDRRAAWRVGFLRLIRWSLGLVWVFILAVVWKHYYERIPMPFDLPAWLPHVASVGSRLLLLTLALTLLAWATFEVVRWPWRAWVRFEQTLVIAHGHPTATPPKTPLMAMMTAVWLLVFLASALTEYGSHNFAELMTAEALFSTLVVAFGLSAFSTQLFLWLKPAPAWHESGRQTTVCAQSKE